MAIDAVGKTKTEQIGRPQISNTRFPHIEEFEFLEWK